MYGVTQEVNARVLRKRLELLRCNGGRSEQNLLLFADNAALVVTQNGSCVDYRVSSVQ